MLYTKVKFSVDILSKTRIFCDKLVKYLYVGGEGLASNTNDNQSKEAVRENKLIKKAQSGNVKAFEKIIDTYQVKIYNMVYRMSGNQNDAFDITQEVLIKIFRNINSFKFESKFSTWVYRVVSNTCLDEMKKIKRKSAYSLDAELITDDGELNVEIPDSQPLPEDELEGKEIRDSITEAISRLSLEHQNVIILRDINGLSYDEIANIIDCSVGTVKSRVSRARKALKKILSEDKELFDKYFV